MNARTLPLADPPATAPLEGVPTVRLLGDTLTQRFTTAVRQRAGAVALRQKSKGVWQAMSWAELGDKVREIALGLTALGLQPGEVVALLSNTRWEWSACDYGILAAGGVSCGIDVAFTASQVSGVCAEASVRFAVVEDDEQLDKLLELRDRLPRLTMIVVIDPRGLADLRDPRVMTLSALLQLGAAHDRAHPGLHARQLGSRGPEDLAIVHRDTASSGPARLQRLSHRQLCSAIDAVAAAMPQDARDDKMAFLPLCQLTERIAGQFLSLQTGSRLNYVEKPETVFDNLREIAPTVFVAVPGVWAQLHSASTQALADATRFEQQACAWALRQGGTRAARREAGMPDGLLQRAALALADTLVLGNVRRFVGVHRMRWALTDGAPIAPELIRWYRAIGLELREGQRVAPDFEPLTTPTAEPGDFQ